MTTFFFDEAEDLEEYQMFRRQDLPLEKTYQKLRVALREAETALRKDPQNREMEATVAELKERLAELERQAPWLTYGYPIEYLLWGPPHG